MIQLRMVRKKSDGGNYDVALSPPVSAENIARLFEKLDHAVAAIPEEKRWNIYYTLGLTSGGEKRDWFGQDVLPFDIDGIKITGEEADDFDPKYLDVIYDALGVEREKCLTVASGNGIHVLIQLERRINEVKFFATQRPAYTRICETVAAALTAAGLPFKDVDTTSFAQNRILRLPGTMNRKPGKKDRLAKFLGGKLTPQPFPICPAAEEIKIKPKDELSKDQMGMFAVDTPAVVAGCDFLKWGKENPGDLLEPQWYAMLSIVGRLDDGRQLAHQYSATHPHYSERDTDRKLDQAVAASGPRTCENINHLWGKCKTCPNFGQVTSPIAIKSETFIATEKSGFYLLSKSGALSPQFEDLRRFFELEHPYKTHEKAGLIYVWEKNRYVIWSQTQLRNYAHTHFRPAPAEKAASEFVQWVNRTNLIGHDWFPNSTRGFINFENGALETATQVLHPHDPSRGFLYVLPFVYDPKALSPVFDRFMDDVTCGDNDLKQMLLEYSGYSICDADYWLQKAVVCVGEGSNGKSTFFKIVEKVAGRENVSFLSLADLQSETSRSHLEGKLFNICDELPNYHFKNTEMLKKLMGGSMTARRLYHDGVMMENRAKLFFSGNDLPETADVSEGFFRRLAIAPFNASFKLQAKKGDKEQKADSTLITQMEAELPGIFNRIFAAYKTLKGRGHLIDSSSASKAKSLYREGTDRVGSWIKDNLYWNGRWDDEAPKVEVATVFERYVSDSKRGEEKPCSKYHFTKHLRRQLDHFDERYVRQRQKNNDRPFVLRGVEIRAEKGATF